MPIVIFRERGADLYAYIARRDLEARVIQIEHNDVDRWGGAISLEGGGRYYVSPQPERPTFPISLRATRSTLI